MWNKYNYWFWIATTLDGEFWDFGKLGSIVAVWKPGYGVRLVFSVQLLMFHLYIGLFDTGWAIKPEYWSHWWQLRKEK